MDMHFDNTLAFLHEMYDTSVSEGEVRIPDFDLDTELVCRLNWAKEDCAAISEQAEKICGDIRRVLNGESSEELKRLCYTYLRNFSSPEFDEEKVNDIYDALFNGDPVSEEDFDYWDRWENARREDYASRLEGFCPGLVVSCAMRYHRILELNAPKAIQSIHKCAIAAALAINKYGTYLDFRERKFEE